MRFPNGGKHSLPSACEQLAHLVVGHLLEIIVEGCNRLARRRAAARRFAGTHDGIFAAGHVRLSRLPVYVSNPTLGSAWRNSIARAAWLPGYLSQFQTGQ